MSGFLAGLVARNTGTSTAIRPHVASVFESPTERRLSMIDSPDVPEADLSRQAPERDSSSKATSTQTRDTSVRATPSRATDLPIADQRTLPPIAPATSSGLTPQPAALFIGEARQPADTEPRLRQSSEPDQIRIGRLVEAMPAAQLSRESPIRTTDDRVAATAIDDEPSVRPIDEGRGLVVAPDIGARIASELQRALSGRQSKPSRRSDERVGTSELKHGVRSEQQINVTIGRVEVRATPETRPANRAKAASPVMTLDEYLTRGSRGAGR
jgi:hypothetical protein